MNKLRHTPGPWIIKEMEDHNNYIRIRGASLGARYKVANVIGQFMNEIDETEANAKLIACAPEMLECLIDNVKYHASTGYQRLIQKSYKTVCSREIKIIEKATGQKIEEIIK